ncbi:S26 family signal peptidase, partial [Citrobacter freundii]|uniref:S26 family signal peptidase n=1 Tax=Citrobacter freundii TaxID=546 RepID=UPI001FFDED6B
MTTISTTGPVPHPRSRLRARLVLAGFATVGLAALAWAAFVQPLPRMAYNPSDSVAVGWYRIEPFDPRTASRPRPLSVDSIVLMPLPDRAAMLAAQRGYLPTRVPLLKRVGAVAPQHVCIVAGQVRIDGVPVAAALPADRLGRPLPSLPPSHRAIGHVVLLFVAVSSRVQCGCIRTALRAAFGAAAQRAGVLPRT